ncbi:MAG: type II toxin-antitoxin system RelE/ParE family toxin [Cyanobacteria bacterium J06576_12]
MREPIGDQIPGVGFTVMKVRVKNRDSQKGKSGGYRLIYWLVSNQVVVLLDVYSKSDRSNIDTVEIRRIINQSDVTPDN